MNRSFPVVHWLLTLFSAPFIGKLVAIVFDSPSAAFIGTLEVYHVTVIGSFILSLPTFLIYLLVVYMIRKSEVADIAKKTILISFVIFGILVTLGLVGGRLKYPLMLIYSSTTVIIGFLLNLRNIKQKATVI